MQRSMKTYKLLCSILLLVSVFTFCFAESAEGPRDMGDREKHIRVCLTRLGGRDRLDFTLTAPYQVKFDSERILYFQPGSQLTFQVDNELIYLHYQDMSLCVGEQVSMERTGIMGTSDPKTGFRLTNFPALYMGDLKLDLVDGGLRPVLDIHVEDYLLGVVPYEMGEAFPLEALKAQAVAARTYALRRQSKSGDYDLVDNTNDQVFKGYIEGHVLSERAVEETRGICGFYKGKLAQCYYSASNGGQTELVQNVWNGREALPYYAVAEDSFDVANPESVVRSFEIFKQYDAEKQAPLRLKQLVTEYLADVLLNVGSEVFEDQFRIDKVHYVAVDTPSLPDSRHMTNLHMELSISVRGNPLKLQSVADTSPEEVHLFETEVSAQNDASAENSNISSARKNTFTPLEQPVTVEIPIFPYAEESLSLSINANYQNEIWSVTETEDRFIVEVRRYGHGVGMSQRGAQWMAAEHGKKYQDILDFYYPGMELVRFAEQAQKFAAADDALAATAGPAPSPTPRPTLMPLTAKPSKGQWIAAVSGISEDSSLNLRSEPSLNSEILMRLYKGQNLLVLERCEEEGWVHVRTDTAEGFVMESYLSKK